jgi:hypothetical protein
MSSFLATMTFEFGVVGCGRESLILGFEAVEAIVATL